MCRSSIRLALGAIEVPFRFDGADGEGADAGGAKSNPNFKSADPAFIPLQNAFAIHKSQAYVARDRARPRLRAGDRRDPRNLPVPPRRARILAARRGLNSKN